MEISTKQEYLDLVPPMSQSEYEKLKSSIKSEGKLMVPVIINQDNVILDGHHRFKACKELGLKLQYNVKDFRGKPLEEKKYVIDVNLLRRHLNEYQKGELGFKLEAIEAQLSQLKKDQTAFTSETGKAAVVKREEQKKEILQKAKHELADFEKAALAAKAARDAKHRETMRQHRQTSKEVYASDTDKEPPYRITSASIAKHVGISSASYERTKKIIQKGTDEQKNQLRKGEVGIRKVYSAIRREEKREQATNDARSRLAQQGLLQKTITTKRDVVPPPTLFQKDMRQITVEEIAPDSIDLIFTDPPYHEHELPIYKDLARQASVWLREGGALVCYAPNYALPTVINYLSSANLHWWWQICVKHSGGRVRMHKYKIWVRWKPLLFFVKGPADQGPVYHHEDIDDLIQSKPAEDGKEVHEHEQSPIEAAYVIQNLSSEFQTVCDPFMGTGTTGVSALKLNRRFIGVDQDESYYVTAMDRLQKTMKGLK